MMPSDYDMVSFLYAKPQRCEYTEFQLKFLLIQQHPDLLLRYLGLVITAY